MKRLTGTTLPRAAALLVTAALAVSACAGAAATGAPTAVPAASTAAAGASPSAAAAYQVAVAQDAKLGAYLTGEDGKSLYLLTSDTSGKSTCTGGCAKAWPPFELDAGETATAGVGVTGTLATITRADDGKQQVTYNGIPLYYFAKDAKAGDVNGQGVKSVWFLVAPGSTAQGGSITGGVGQVAASSPAAPSASAAAGSVASPSAPAASTGSSVQIANFAFAPPNLSVKVGTTVTWTNTDGASHTVTADNGSFGGKLASGGTFKETFAKAGTYAYHCAIHPSMTGTVTVAS